MSITNKAGTYIYTISEVVPEGAKNNVKDHIAYDVRSMMSRLR